MEERPNTHKVFDVNESLFGTELRQMRRAAHLNLVDLAKAAGCSVVYISQIERGEKPPPSAKLIEALVKRIGCIERLPEMLRLADHSRRAVEFALKNKSEELADMLLALKRKVEAGEVTDEVARQFRQLLGE
jgi:transcriptional regulator with XRE-family HTH domain